MKSKKIDSNKFVQTTSETQRGINTNHIFQFIFHITELNL